MTEPIEPNKAGGPVLYSYAPFSDDDNAVSLSPLRMVNALLRQRRWIVAISLLFSVAGLSATLLLRGWRSEASFAPSSPPQSGSQLAGLAAQFGVNIGGLEGGPSLDFYSALVKSRAILEDAVTSRYVFTIDKAGHDTVAGTLLELYGVHGDTPTLRLQRAVKRLDRNVSVTKDEDAGIVTVQVVAKWPRLAEQIGARILDLVNTFNLTNRQTQAGTERQFVEGRLAEVSLQLDSAEAAMRRFMESNLTIETSPRLRLEMARLQRRVDFVQQVHLTLAQAYEQARIEEVRNTPVITLLDRPEGSGKHSVSLLTAGVVSLVLGFLVALVWALLRDYASRQRVEEAEAFREFAELRQMAVRDLTALPRGVMGVLRRMS